MHPVQRISVPFQGLRAGTEDLTWGQREIWLAMVAQRSWLPIPVVRELEPGNTLDDVVSELRFCLGRYDSMRTRLSFDAAGEPRQVVAGEGELVLDAFEAGDADPVAVAAQVEQWYRDADFDFTRDWPVRAGVVLAHGVPSHTVSVYSHLVMDGVAMLALLGRLAGGEDLPTGAMQPMELARWERSEAAARANATAMRHWESILRQLPARRFPGSTDRHRPRYWQAGFRSRTLYLALQALSRRAKATTAALLAVFAVALGRVTGGSPVVAQVVVSNRFRTHLAGVFAPVNQTGLWVVDVAGATMDEVLGQARRRATSAYKYAYYDPRECGELIARVSRERGEDIDVGCFVNDRRLTTATVPAGADPTAAQLRGALSQTTFAWQVRTDSPHEPFSLNAEDVPEVLNLTVWIDTHMFAPADLVAVLHEMEAVAVTAVTDPGAPTGVGASAPAEVAERT